MNVAWKRGALAALVLAVASALSACDPSASPSMYGVNGTSDARDIALMQQAGFRWQRIFVHWDHLEPTPWTLDAKQVAGLDGEVNALTKAGFSVDVTINQVPGWTNNPSAKRHDACTGPVPASPAFYQDFMRQMAAHLGDRVAAWELFNEPDWSCNFAGTPSEFVSLMFGPGFDGIKQARPKAIVLGPALEHVNQLDDYYTTVVNGVRLLPRRIDFYNVHHYGSVSDIETALDTADKWAACATPGDASSCVTQYWLTEFGFREDDSPAGKSSQVLNYCRRSQSSCRKAFYFDSANFYDKNATQLALLNTDFTPRAKYYEIKQYIANRPG